MAWRDEQETQQVKMQVWQLAAKMVPCKFISTWSTRRREKVVPPARRKGKEMQRGKV